MIKSQLSNFKKMTRNRFKFLEQVTIETFLINLSTKKIFPLVFCEIPLSNLSRRSRVSRQLRFCCSIVELSFFDYVHRFFKNSLLARYSFSCVTSCNELLYSAYHGYLIIFCVMGEFFSDFEENLKIEFGSNLPNHPLF